MSSRRALATASLLMMLSACSGGAAPESGGQDSEPIANGPSPAGAEGKAAGAAPAAGGAVLDLGSVAAGAPVSFAVPAGTVGFTIIVDGTAGPVESIGVQELTDPSGTALVRNFRGVAESAPPASGTNGYGIGVVSIPFPDDRASQPVASGTWTAKLGGLTGATKGATGTARAGTVHASVRFQSSRDGAFHGGALDLDLYVPAGLTVYGATRSHTVTAASAAADADVQSRLDLAFGLFRRLYGLERGQVRYHALPATLREVASQSAVEAANVLATAVNAHPAAQVILTNRLSPDGNDSEISGVSNCLPGAVGVPGTRCSAVIVSFRARTPAWEDATTIVHELGHFVGLAHTTEFGGDADALADTPVCTDTTKSALPHCPDHDNLMFPSVNMADAADAVSVSPTQQAIMRSSPLYRATP